MLKFHNFDIVCQEIPDEVTLAINITGCPNRCPGCHSQWLWDDTGTPLDFDSLTTLLQEYGNVVTCVCFMGGDQAPAEVQSLAKCVKSTFPTLKTAWYSGKEEISTDITVTTFDFIKTGAYVEHLGALKSKQTNQRLYAITPDGSKTGITSRFWK